MDEVIKLTQFSHSSGCGCKIAPAVLQTILASNQNLLPPSPKLLVGYNTNDDAAVYELNAETCLISTTDFFTPLVNDAFDFGRIAAANALSDVYAMGGKPLMAIAILGWPVDKLASTLASKVLDGGRSICAEAEISLAGGHSIDSPEPFFGLAVTGVVSTSNLKRNNQAAPGDYILLTKPLGSGILSSALKRDLLDETGYQQLLQTVTALNSVGEMLGAIPGVRAMTDVTGFGLLGHLLEMCSGAGVGAEISYAGLPKLSGVGEFIKKGIGPDATFRNWNAYNKQVKIEKAVPMMEAFKLLPDPQTNGGLLLAVQPDALPTVSKLFEQLGIQQFATPIGQFTNLGQHETLLVTP